MISFIKNRESYPDELEVWQVSKILNCSPQYVYRLLCQKQLVHYRVGKKYYIETDDLIRFLEKRKIETAEPHEGEQNVFHTNDNTSGRG